MSSSDQEWKEEDDDDDDDDDYESGGDHLCRIHYFDLQWERYFAERRWDGMRDLLKTLIAEHRERRLRMGDHCPAVRNLYDEYVPLFFTIAEQNVRPQPLLRDIVLESVRRGGWQILLMKALRREESCVSDILLDTLTNHCGYPMERISRVLFFPFGGLDPSEDGEASTATTVAAMTMTVAEKVAQRERHNIATNLCRTWMKVAYMSDWHPGSYVPTMELHRLVGGLCPLHRLDPMINSDDLAHQMTLQDEEADRLPLHYAAIFPCHDAIWEKDFKKKKKRTITAATTTTTKGPSQSCLEFLLEKYPDGASVPDRSGRLPLHYALENYFPWIHDRFFVPRRSYASERASRAYFRDRIVAGLRRSAPKSISQRDPVTKLYPYQLAASSGCPLSIIYELLRGDPSVLKEAAADADTTLLLPSSEQERYLEQKHDRMRMEYDLLLQERDRLLEAKSSSPIEDAKEEEQQQQRNEPDSRARLHVSKRRRLIFSWMACGT